MYVYGHFMPRKRTLEREIPSELSWMGDTSCKTDHVKFFYIGNPQGRCVKRLIPEILVAGLKEYSGQEAEFGMYIAN